jgi:hypothetical protein
MKFNFTIRNNIYIKIIGYETDAEIKEKKDSAYFYGISL